MGYPAGCHRAGRWASYSGIVDQYGDLHARIEALRDRVEHDGSKPDVLAEINDVLSEGYARAMSGEQRLAALNEWLVEVLLGPDERRARELRAVADERRVAARSIARLRAELADMHDRFVVLTGS
jgi:hypothetical protein